MLDLQRINSGKMLWGRLVDIHIEVEIDGMMRTESPREEILRRKAEF